MAGGAEGAGGAGGRLGDIIDLDRYMRAAVRRSASDTTDDGRTDRLVVDGGGGGIGAVKPTAGSSSSAGRPARTHHKRFSHDSGLSDGSYAPRVRRPHRRLSAAEGTGGRCGREARDTRLPRGTDASSNSLREFRAVCERALLDQRQQLARVTQLCERLTAPALPPAAAQDSSDISSSSCSTRDQRRKDKHRAAECKTYKIIMNKLDELNRLFAARGRSPPTALSRSPAPAACRRRAPSSCSVSVSDKLVSTEPIEKRPKQVERATGGGEWAASRAGERRTVRAVTHAYALDIAPQDLTRNKERRNVTTESIVERDSTGDECASSGCDARCGFDLDDPVHLYAQAKRLQAMHASTRRSKSAGYEASRGSRRDKRLGERLDKRAGSGESSLCALCRGYWRAVRRYIGTQLSGPNS
ncbi:uncharacterized protein LOC115453436 isoform X2 [Manduca sexta]|uniref:Uncharacterized protein n=1 Tax=Manduca sexta TaxID=7130 RepID=A0A921ZVJ2_MANSE|nr:uncharacterized protein LOC115453436 isoform X2 [Manduca sexta]KAG6464921.1 hypothetical protein O3G_MSEX014818 [Manduca sexta]KAG6464922.1 hypothetical protein O3G_MSEX014818 [Manduca sexta]